jgi:hypothetical protein
VFGRDELERQTREIARDKENLHVRRVCVFHFFARPLAGSLVCTTVGRRVSYTMTSPRLRLKSRRWMGFEIN